MTHRKKLVTQQPRCVPGLANVVQTEQNNAAVAVGASMARAVLAAEHFRQLGTLPAWATDPERTPNP